MKKYLLNFFISLSVFLFSFPVFAGAGRGKIIDVTVRVQDNLLLVRVEASISQPTCVTTSTWHHNFGIKLDPSNVASMSLYSIFLTSYNWARPVYIQGTGNCIPGTGSEEIREANMGLWMQ